MTLSVTISEACAYCPRPLPTIDPNADVEVILHWINAVRNNIVNLGQCAGWTQTERAEELMGAALHHLHEVKSHIFGDAPRQREALRQRLIAEQIESLKEEMLPGETITIEKPEPRKESV